MMIPWQDKNESLKECLKIACDKGAVKKRYYETGSGARRGSAALLCMT